jgi:nucleoside-diphosphate-sugar epimerase
LIEEVFRKSALVEHQPEQPGDVRCTQSNPALYPNGYTPVVPINAGIQEFCSWMKGQGVAL